MKKPTTKPTTTSAQNTASIDHLTLENVRCFQHAEVSFAPNCTVLIGENGSGKTTLIEALASLCEGGDEGLESFPVRRGEKQARIQLDGVGGVIADWRLAPGEHRRRLDAATPLFAYGRYRLVQDPPVEAPAREGLKPSVVLPAAWIVPSPVDANLEEAVRHRRTKTLTRPDNHLLTDMGAYLVMLHQRSTYDARMRIAWEQLNASIQRLGQGLEQIEIAIIEDREVPLIRRSGVQLSLRELSDGYQAVLVIVFDLLIRYFYLFPEHKNPLAARATVLIDEIELHLHPRWQRLVLGQLVRTFPGTQFICTTHSAEVVQGAIDEGYRLVILRNHGSHSTASTLSAGQIKGLRNADIGALLTDGRLFDVPSRYSKRVEDNLENKMKQLESRVDGDEASASERQELLKTMDRLEEIEAENEKRRAAGPLLSTIAKAQIGFLRKLEQTIEKEGAHGAAPSNGNKAKRKVGRSPRRQD